MSDEPTSNPELTKEPLSVVDFRERIEAIAMREMTLTYIPGTRLKQQHPEDRIRAGEDLLSTLADYGIVPVTEARFDAFTRLETELEEARRVIKAVHGVLVETAAQAVLLARALSQPDTDTGKDAEDA